MADRLHRRGNTWHTWGYDSQGVRWHESTHQTDRKAALAVARDIARRRASPADAAREAATLADAVATFLTDLRGRTRGRTRTRSEATLAFYTQKTGHWRRLLGDDFRLSTLHARDVDRVLTARREEDASEATIAKELIALRRVLRTAIRAGLWQGDPAAILPSATTAAYRPRTRWLTLAEVQALLGELDAEDGARVAFIVATSASAGEADRAERGDVRVWPGAGFIVAIRGTKTRARAREVPVVLAEQIRLLEYALAHAVEVEGRLFRPYDPRTSNFRRALLAACKRAGIAPCTQNDLRRTTAQWLRRARVPLEYVSATLGHVDTRMVERVYGRLDAEAVGRGVLNAAGIAAPAATHLQQSAVEPVETVERVEAETAVNMGGSCGGRTHDLRIKSPQGGSIAILLPAPRKPHITKQLAAWRATHLQQRAKR